MPRSCGALIALLWALCPTSGLAAERWFGLGAGLGTTLAPADRLGAWITASAATGTQLDDSRKRLVSGRGTVAGFVGRDSWAVMPLLSGDLSAGVGPVQAALTGGVQIFGGARRQGWTVFATFGLLGGAGLSLQLTTNTRLCLRGQVIWLPSSTTAKLDSPEDPDADKPTFLLFSGGLSIELRQDFADDF